MIQAQFSFWGKGCMSGRNAARNVHIISASSSYWIEEFRLPGGTTAGKIAVMPVFPSPLACGSRIRRDYPVIKGGIIPSNSR